MQDFVVHSRFALLVFIFSFVALIAIASPVYPSVRQTILQQQNSTLRTTSLFHKDDPIGKTFSELQSYDQLHSRMMPGLTPIFKVHQVRFKQMTDIIPVQAAAPILENFFISVATQADPQLGEWAKMTPTNVLELKHGMFKLRFHSIGDTIPWSFVRDFANKLWETAALGVADLFETVYEDQSGKVAVQISLTIMNEMTEATGSASGSDQDNFYRDGSWDSVQSGNGA